MVVAMLKRTSKRIEVRIPFYGMDYSNPYWRLCSDGTGFADNSDQYQPPKSVLFLDPDGPVGLVGIHSLLSRPKFNVSIAGISGEGLLAVDFAVLGTGSCAAYESINGLLSEVEGLGEWIGHRSLGRELLEQTKGSWPESVTVRLKEPPPIRVTHSLQFQIVRRSSLGGDQMTISEQTLAHTQFEESVDWNDHLHIHFRVRDLLRVSAWKPLNFVSHDVMSISDPARDLDGKAYGEQWLPVITHRTGIEPATTKPNDPDYLFWFADVGEAGVRRWLDLSRAFEREMYTLTRLLNLKGASLEAHIAQVGIGFERLGYALLIKSGETEKKAKDASIASKIKAVSSEVSDVLPFSAEKFPKLLADAYNGVKHPNRAYPESQELLLAYRQAVQVFRAWVALRLDVPKSTLKDALRRDGITLAILRSGGTDPAVSTAEQT
ncbi:MAG: hypothetical protein LBG44_09985 [Gemmatimonadota bacterium]|jgi:hypothetical protein|nr:hypothetical protein [Gemmatimonadota bacterium]